MPTLSKMLMSLDPLIIDTLRSMETIPSSQPALIQALEQGLAEIVSINKRISATEQLKNENPQRKESLDSLVRQYINTKAQIVEKYRNHIQALDKALGAKSQALRLQQNKSDSINTELMVEEKLGEDPHKINKLKSDLSSVRDVLDQLSKERAELDAVKTKFLDGVEEHGFDRISLTPPYEIVGSVSASTCPKCKSEKTVYLDDNKSVNPRAKCTSCGNVWKT